MSAFDAQQNRKAFLSAVHRRSISRVENRRAARPARNRGRGGGPKYGRNKLVAEKPPIENEIRARNAELSQFKAEYAQAEDEHKARLEVKIKTAEAN
jgi:hypothetical protein